MKNAFQHSEVLLQAIWNRGAFERALGHIPKEDRYYCLEVSLQVDAWRQLCAQPEPTINELALVSAYAVYDNYYETRDGVIEVLFAHQPPLATFVAKTMVRSPDAYEREKAIEGIFRYAPPALTIQLATDLLADSDPNVVDTCREILSDPDIAIAPDRSAAKPLPINGVEDESNVFALAAALWGTTPEIQAKGLQSLHETPAIELIALIARAIKERISENHRRLKEVSPELAHLLFETH